MKKFLLICFLGLLAFTAVSQDAETEDMPAVDSELSIEPGQALIQFPPEELGLEDEMDDHTLYHTSLLAVESSDGEYFLAPAANGVFIDLNENSEEAPAEELSPSSLISLATEDGTPYYLTTDGRVMIEAPGDNGNQFQFRQVGLATFPFALKQVNVKNDGKVTVGQAQDAQRVIRVRPAGQGLFSNTGPPRITRRLSNIIPTRQQIQDSGRRIAARIRGVPSNSDKKFTKKVLGKVIQGTEGAIYKAAKATRRVIQTVSRAADKVANNVKEGVIRPTGAAIKRGARKGKAVATSNALALSNRISTVSSKINQKLMKMQFSEELLKNRLVAAVEKIKRTQNDVVAAAVKAQQVASAAEKITAAAADQTTKALDAADLATKTMSDAAAKTAQRSLIEAKRAAVKVARKIVLKMLKAARAQIKSGQKKLKTRVVSKVKKIVQKVKRLDAKVKGQVKKGKKVNQKLKAKMQKLKAKAKKLLLKARRGKPSKKQLKKMEAKILKKLERKYGKKKARAMAKKIMKKLRKGLKKGKNGKGKNGKGKVGKSGKGKGKNGKGKLSSVAAYLAKKRAAARKKANGGDFVIPIYVGKGNSINPEDVDRFTLKSLDGVKSLLNEKMETDKKVFKQSEKTITKAHKTSHKLRAQYIRVCKQKICVLRKL